MRANSTNLRPILSLMLGGALLAASFIAESNPAGAFGMHGFGHMSGYRSAHVGMRAGLRREMIVPRRGYGRVPGRPPGWESENAALESKGDSRNHRISGRIDRDRGWPVRRWGSPGLHIPGLPGAGGLIPGTVTSDFPAGGTGRAGDGAGGSSSGGSGAGGGAGSSNNGGGSGVPPRGERRFVPNEVITEFSSSLPPRSLAQIARRYDLTLLESRSFRLIGSTFYRWRIGGRGSVSDTVGALEGQHIVASAQPNYIFTLQEDAAKISHAARGDAAQYVLRKLQVEQAHQVATGKDVLVALIDSQVDVQHADLDAAVVQSFDVSTGEATPHQHGTAMAGAIAAHGNLLGVAPAARLLAARAFDDTPSEAKGTSFGIYKSLQWAADNGARVVNMSFAGPADPALHRLLAAAYEKDIVLIAAAGNAGPNSAPLYPAADPNVIAVTATDSNDGLFKMANRGSYIAVAAPGVEILALAPSNSYQITTGTSVAAAHVSGMVALMLERRPSLKPEDIRTIIRTTAQPLTSVGLHSDSGAALVNAYRAVLLLRQPVGKAGSEQAKR